MIKLHKCVFSKFKKFNFDYEFNIRHITGVFQGILSTIEKSKEKEKMAKLWIHEFERVNGEWLVSIKDFKTLRGELEGEVIKIAFIGKFNLGKYLTDKSEPIIFCRFPEVIYTVYMIWAIN